MSESGVDFDLNQVWSQYRTYFFNDDPEEYYNRDVRFWFNYDDSPTQISTAYENAAIAMALAEWGWELAANHMLYPEMKRGT